MQCVPQPPRLERNDLAGRGSDLGDFDAGRMKSNSFEIEWPPRSGKKQAFPEVDRAGWFDLEVARRKVLPAQAVFLDRLERAAAGAPPPSDEASS